MGKIKLVLLFIKKSRKGISFIVWGIKESSIQGKALNAEVRAGIILVR